jgi:hypothetical protein
MPCPLQNPAYLNEILQSILDSVCLCLADTTLGQPEDCFISHTRPPDDCCDYLAIWMERMLPTYEFPFINEAKPDTTCGTVHRMMEVKLKLARSCYPVVADNAANPFPPPATIQAAAEALLIDANVLWCCVQCAFDDGAPWPDDACLDARFNELVMDRPRGGCAGMTISFLLELDHCC